MNTKIKLGLIAVIVPLILVQPAFGQGQPTTGLQTQLNSLLQQLQQLQSQLPQGGAQALANVVIPNLTRNFGLGSTDATTAGEVSKWQDFLVAQDKGQFARELKNGLNFVPKGYFGPGTGRATEEWQRAMGITPTCKCVGLRTRAAVANLGRSQEQLRVVSPNGGEILEIGKTYTIKWTGPAVISEGYSLSIILTRIPTATLGSYVGDVNLITSNLTIRNKQYSWQVNTLSGGDIAGIPIEAGNYKIKLTLYDGVPCSFCPPAPTPVNIVAQDESDATFQIVAAGSVTAPTISSISPASGVVGTTVVLKGSSFNALHNRVWMQRERPGGYPLAIIGNPTLVDNSTLQFVVPATGIIAPALPCVGLPGCESATGPLTSGLYKVSVLNDFGTGVSNLVDFTITSTSGPNITSISPLTGPVGTQVTITGSGFTTTGNRINFDFTPNTSEPLWSNLNSANGSTLSFDLPGTNGAVCFNWPCLLTLPVNPGLHKISVTNTNGTSNSVNFTVTSY